MSRLVLAPLAVALSALLLAPQVLGDTTSPLFVVEQQRSALVARLARQWSDAFAALPKERRLDHEQLSSALFALRADRLFAVTLAGDADVVEAVLGDAKREATKPRSAAKALGDATADLTYTPINPCRILDTRATAAGPLAPNVARTFDGYSTNFASQGGTGSGCGIPNGVAALAMNVYAVNPTNLGFIKVWPANATEPDVSTVNYQVGITAIATGTLVPVDQANSNRFTAKSPASVDFIADVVGYFKPPGDATSLDIKVAGKRVMRYDWSNPSAPNILGGYAANAVATGASGATIGGGGQAPGYQTGPNVVSDDFGTIAGGLFNVAGDGDGNVYNAAYSTVGGGYRNSATGYSATIAGGNLNTASGLYAEVAGGLINSADGSHSVVGGGRQNSATGNESVTAGGINNIASGDRSSISGGLKGRASGSYSVIGGGDANNASGDRTTIAGGANNVATSYFAAIGGGIGNSAIAHTTTIAGGSDNVASGTGSTVVGGSSNTASGSFSVAAGQRAKTQTANSPPSIHDGTFIFADGSSFDFNSAASNEFAARTTGGVRFVTAIDGTGLPTWTCGVSGGAGGSWGCTSDRSAKTDLIALDGVATLERLAALPVYQWVAKDDLRRTPHAGPSAQDFMAAFGLGDNDRMIGFADAQGVLLSAVQGLNAKLDERLAEKDREIAELKRAVEILLARTSPEGRVAERR